MLAKHFAFAAIAAIVAPVQVNAQTAVEYEALQFALKQNHFYDGVVDGKVGPNTRKAMLAFSTAEKVENNFWFIASRLSVQTHWEVNWTPAAEKAILVNLDGVLLDAPSARIKQKLLFRSGEAASACVEVNSKNSYGAYGGYQWLYYTLVEINYAKSSFMELEDSAFAVGPYPVSAEVAETLCMLGFVRTNQ